MMTWDAWLMGHAKLAATKSKDSTQVGAALVAPDKSVRLTAYNGIPRGVADLPERRERPVKYLYSAHAEANLIYAAAKAGIQTDGCMVYVTHRPCATCAGAMIQAGIFAVIYGGGQTSMPQEEFDAAAAMFEEAG